MNMKNNQKQKFLPDDYIFKQGDKGEKAYLLLDGRVAIEVNNNNKCQLSKCQLSKCHLSKCHLNKCHLSICQLSG